MDIILYSRSRCPLCDKAKEILDLYCETTGHAYREVDIHSDDVLLEKYQLMIPVVEIDGEVAMVGKITYSGLKNYVENRTRRFS